MQQVYSTKNWDDFYLQFKHSAIGADLARSVPKKLIQQYLSPVLTLKHAIEHWNLLDLDREDLVIGIHGPELPELTDEGRWFGLLPMFLGREMKIRLVYQQAKTKPIPSPNPEALKLLPEVAVNLDGDLSEADIVVISHPDFITKHRDKDINLEFRPVPVLALFWSALDVSMEGGWFEHHGLAEMDRMSNPFAMQNNVDTSASWARFVTWIKPDEDATPRMSWERLIDLGWIRHHSGVIGYGHPTGQPGKLRKDFQLRGLDSNMGFLYVIDDLYLNQTNHWLYRFDSETRALEPIYEVDSSVFNQIPKPSDDILVAYEWAAMIKLAYAFSPLESESESQKYFTWLQSAAKRGNAHASMACARWLEAGYLKEPNLDHAFYEYRRAADAGLASAQYIVAEIAFHDLKDRELATEYFTLAADKGYALAQFNLGLIHLDRMVTNTDPETGIQYLKKAAAAGEVNALCYLGEWMSNQGKLAEAMDYWLKAADLGSIEAAGQVLNHAEVWRQQLPEKSARGFKKRVRHYSKMVKSQRTNVQ